MRLVESETDGNSASPAAVAASQWAGPGCQPRPRVGMEFMVQLWNVIPATLRDEERLFLQLSGKIKKS